MAHRTPPRKTEPILIVGAGVFGLSTALELKNRGYRDVTVVDRFLPPVVDGSSVDISRVIRVDYADPLYAKMAREAHHGWTTEYKDHYHSSGFVMLCDKSGSHYIDKAMEVTRATGGEKLDVYPEAKAVVDKYPSIPSNLDGHKAYVNEKGGWADAEASILQLSMKCSQAGVCFITGPRGTVVSIRRSRGNGGGRVTGVDVAHGEPIFASLVILSTGAWSNRLLPLAHATTASAQPVGFIQLTEDEAEPLTDMPVIINLSTGIFCFPPTPKTKILKIARHGYGFATQVAVDEGSSSRMVSSPKRDSNNASNSYLTDDAEKGLRDGLRQLLPAFAHHAWMNRRFCWYSDTPNGDFIVDYHPEAEGLFLATAGAGQYVHLDLIHLWKWSSTMQSANISLVASSSYQFWADISWTVLRIRPQIRFASSGG